MSLSPERQQILQMIEDDTITPEEGLSLLKALEASDGGEMRGSDVPPAEDAAPAIEGSAAPTFDQGRIRRVKRWWIVPWGIGIGGTLLGGWWMVRALQIHGVSLLFFLTWIPFLFGIGITALGWRSRTSPWLHLKIQQKPGSQPRRLMFSFPIPIHLLAWSLRTFGDWVPKIDATGVDEVLIALQESAHENMPLIIAVDEGEGGEKVQVIIG